MSWPKHGANPNDLTTFLGKKLHKQSIDFSVNTNPLGPPSFIKEHWEAFYSHVEQYPDPYGRQLKQAIAEENDVLAEQVLLGNGAAELIFLIAQSFQGKRGLIVEPTFTEYRDGCKAYDIKVESLILQEEDDWQLTYDLLEQRLAHVDIVFICHPNNPTGVIYEQEVFERVLKKAEESGTIIVVDEAFYDFCEQSETLVERTKTSQHLIVLRSMTKMYAIAGLRLGYLIAHRNMISNLQQRLPHWNVNGLAQSIGVYCLKERTFVEETKTYVTKQREKLLASLRELGYYCSPSHVNYFLLRDQSSSSEELLTFLLDERIVSRHTYNFIGLDGRYLRLAIKKEAENEQLLQALKRWKERC